MLWEKPDTAIAAIDGCSDRNARRILRGELPIPAKVLVAACEEMLRPLADNE